MRLNRGTILLLVASLVIILVVLIINSQRATAPDVTPTAAASNAGPIFPDISLTENQSAINRFEVVNHTEDTRFLMTKGDDNLWVIEEAANPSDLGVDQTLAVGTMSNLASLAATNSFTTENLADFGLDSPDYTLTLMDSEGQTYTVQIGNQSPTSPRYYALVNDDTQTVYILPKDIVDNLVRQINQPPYLPSPTPTATFTATPNPYSEVEQTATAAVQQTATMQATLEMSAEVTAEATGEATPEAAS